jgi:hypothetical protein
MPDPQTPLVEADSNNQIKLELPILINHGKFQSTKLDRGSWSLDHRQKPFALVVHNVRFPEKTGVFTCLVSPGGTIISCMSRLSWNQMMWWVNSLPDDQILTTDWINLYEIVSGVQSLNGYVSWPIWQAHMDRLKEPGMSIDDEPFVYSPKCFKEAKVC